MKQSIIYSFILFHLFVLSSSVFAQSMHFEVPDTSMAEGDTITIPIYADSTFTGKGIKSYQLEFTYSTSYLEVLGTSGSGAIASQGTFIANTAVGGKIRVAGARGTEFTGKGKFFFVTFRVLRGGGTRIDMNTSSTTSYFNEGNSSVSIDNGYFSISYAPEVSISPSYQSLLRGDSVKLSVYGDKVDPCEFTVRKPSIGTVTEDNYFKAQSPGVTKIEVEDANGTSATSGNFTVYGYRLSTPTDLSQYQGDTVEVPIYTTTLDGLGVTSGSFDFTYSSNLLSYVDVSTDSCLLDGASIQVGSENGSASVAFASTHVLSGNGVLMIMRFAVSSENSGRTSLSFSNILFNESLSGLYSTGYCYATGLPSLYLSPNGKTMYAGDSLQLSVSNGIEPYLFSVNNENIASVNQAGVLKVSRGGQVRVLVEDSIGASITSNTFTVYDAQVEIPDTTGPVGAFYNLPIFVGDLPVGLSVSSLETQISYDDEKLEFVGLIEENTLTDGWSFVHSESSDEVMIAGAGTQRFTDGGVLFYLRFKLRETFTLGQRVYLSFDKLMFNEGGPSLTMENGYITASKSEDLSLAQIISPVSDCSHSEAEIVEIEIANKGYIDYEVGDTLMVSYRFNYQEENIDTIVLHSTLPSGGKMKYQFSAPIDMLAVRNYKLECKILLSSYKDGNTSNDAIYTWVETYGMPSLDLGEDIVAYSGDTIFLHSPSSFESYLWSTGNVDIPSIAITESDTVWMMGTDANGCEISDTIVVMFISKPEKPIVTAEQTEFCYGEHVILEAPEGYHGYLWNTGDNQRTLEVSTSGDYFVQVINEDSIYSDPSDTVSILIHNEVLADFGYTKGDDDFEIAFENLSQNYTTSSWYFNDEDVLTVNSDSTLLHRFSNLGENQVKLIVSNGYCVDSIVDTLVIVQEIVSDTSVWICEGEVYAFGEHMLMTTGVYSDTFTVSEFVDSIAQLNLFVADVDTIIDHLEITEFDLPYHYYGEIIPVGTSSGDTIFTYSSASSCDSIVQLLLTIHQEYVLTGEDFVLVDGDIVSCLYDFSSKLIRIPAEIDEQSVTGIGSDCFREKGIKRVDIPNSVNKIADYAFYGNALSEVQLPGQVDYIGKNAFSNNNITTSIDLPNPVIKDGYKFNHWLNGSDSVVTQILDLSDEYVANFEINNYNINYFNVGVDSVNPSTYTVEDNLILLPPAAVSDTANFGGWFTNQSLSDTVSIPAIEKGSTGYLSFYAKWNPIPMIISTDVDKPYYNLGENISFYGFAVNELGNPLIGERIETTISINYSERKYYSTTDSLGYFVVNFIPLQNEAGHVLAQSKGVAQESNLSILEFDILGSKLTTAGYIIWDFTVGEDINDSLTFVNRSSMDLTGLNIEILEKPDNCEIEFEVPETLRGEEEISVSYKVSANDFSKGVDYEKVSLKLTSNEGAFTEFNTWFFAQNPKGLIVAEPTVLETTVTKDSVRTVDVTITNIGAGATGAISIAMPNSEWFTLVGPSDLSSLDSTNSSATLSLRLAPTEDIPVNVPSTGNIAVNYSNGDGALLIPFRLEVVSEQTGALLVDVTDEYTYNTPSAPHLEGAHIVVRHPYTGDVVAEGKTGVDGIFRSDSLPEGYYTVNVDADSHESYQNNILINPGQTKELDVVISFEAISYSWSVERTEIEDEYDIELVMDFETNVPVPVVEMDIPKVMPGLAVGEKYEFMVTLTNYGLITAEDVLLTFPEDPEYVFLGIPEAMEVLAQQAVQVPIVMKRKDDVEVQEKSVVTMKSENEYPCTAVVGLKYAWVCGPDKKWHFQGPVIKYGNRICNSGSTNAALSNSSSGTVSGGTTGTPSRSSGSVSSSSGSYTSGGVSTSSNDDCNPGDICLKESSIDLLDAALGCSSIGGPLSCMKLGMGDVSLGNALSCGCVAISKVSIYGAVGCGIYSFGSCLKSLYDATVCITPTLGGGFPDISNPTLKSASIISTSDESVVAQDLKMVLQTFDSYGDYLITVFDDTTLYSKTDFIKFAKDVSGYVDSLLLISDSDLVNLLVEYSTTDITQIQIERFVNKWNTSLTVWEGGVTSPNKDYPSIISRDSLDGYFNRINEAYSYTESRGFEDMGKLYDNAYLTLEEIVNKPESSVCVGVKLKIDQKMTMTREAFRGSLTISNGHESEAITNFALNLEIKDEEGKICNDLFQISTESLSGITAIDGSGVIESDSEGTANILFIPSNEAAPEIAKSYSFGGTFKYYSPFAEDTVEQILYPITLEVRPNPNLEIHYFLQRDILGDDALTLDVVEPTIPAELGVLIHNTGSGTAQNVRIASAQPEIIENEKGLAIDFKIIGSSLNGNAIELGLNDIDFGNIEANETAVGQWWLTSSLLGHFVAREASFEQVMSDGTANISLLDTVVIHNLIHGVTAYGNDVDSIGDFLVDDAQDAEKIPDAIFMSDGQSVEVLEAKGISITDNSLLSNHTITLEVSPENTSWNYARIEDPGQGDYVIKSVTRSDGVEIPLSNIWLTDRTLPDGGEPIYEDVMHFVDDFATLSTQSYLIEFEAKETDIPSVVSLLGIPETVSDTCITNVVVIFDSPIVDSTFTYEDIELKCQGGDNLIDSSVLITKVSENQYGVDLTALTDSNGFYVLTIHTQNIFNASGANGNLGKMVNWSQFVITLETSESVSICEGESYKGWTMPDTYVETFRSVEGYDSIVTTILEVKPAYNLTDTLVLCPSELPYDYYGINFPIGSVSKDTLLSYNTILGCDSTIELSLMINPSYNTYDSLTLCESELPYMYSGEEISEGTMSDNLEFVFTSINGCDSVVNLNLTVNPTYDVDIADTICQGDTLTFGSQYIFDSGVYEELFTSQSGCDSLVQFSLTVNPVYDVAMSMSINYLDSLIFGTSVLKQAGEYSQQFISSLGCDSIVTINLSVVKDSSSSVDQISDNAFILYPNPTKDIIFINSQKLYVLSLIDLSGNLLLRREMILCDEEIDLSTFNSGIYFLQVSDGDDVVVRQIIKQ